MNQAGIPSEWLDLIDSLVPDIVNLVVATWEEMPALSQDAREDPTTEMLCRLLRMNRNASALPFQIQIQMVDLDPAMGEDQGRMDITFCPLVPREDIYFCLECKRLNVMKGGERRAYATEYVVNGMVRFVRGQYAAIVRHGGMLGYVLDGDLKRAMENVSCAIQTNYANLAMQAPGEMRPSSLFPDDLRIRETHHNRQQNAESFRLHHMFMSGLKPESGACSDGPRATGRMAAFTGSPTPDADRDLARNNIAKWCNAEYDALVTRAKLTAKQTEREALYRAAQEIFKREASWVPLAHSIVFMATRKEVTGFKMDPLGRHPFEGVDLLE
jgi:hypothetical protein